MPDIETPLPSPDLIVSRDRTDGTDQKLVNLLGFPLILLVFSLGGHIIAAEEKIDGIRIARLVSLSNIFIKRVQ